MTPHPSHPTLAPSPPPAPIGRGAGGVPLMDLLRAGLIRMNGTPDDAGERPSAAA